MDQVTVLEYGGREYTVRQVLGTCIVTHREVEYPTSGFLDGWAALVDGEDGGEACWRVFTAAEDLVGLVPAVGGDVESVHATIVHVLVDGLQARVEASWPKVGQWVKAEPTEPITRRRGGSVYEGELVEVVRKEGSDRQVLGRVRDEHGNEGRWPIGWLRVVERGL